MRLILHYYGSGIDGRNAPVQCAVEAESKQEVFAEFRSALKDALRAGAAYLTFAGTRHYLHNFVHPITEDRMAYLAKLAQLRGRKLPEVVEHGERLYALTRPSLATVEEWLVKLS